MIRCLEDVVDNANNSIGVTAAARLQRSLEALAALPVRVLADNGASQTRPRRMLGRLRRIAEGRMLDDEEEEEDDDVEDGLRPAPAGSRRRRLPEQAKLVARIERHASQGSIKRAAAALSAEPLADTSDPAVMAKLRALHPDAEPPTTLATEEPAIQITAETLEAVARRLGAHSRGSAGGPTGWTYEIVFNQTKDV